MSEQVLLAGFAERVVTPPMGFEIPGYYSVRKADGIISDLYIRATAFQLGEQKVILFDCDAISMKLSAYLILRKMIAQRCALEETAVYIACTHTHTGFRIEDPATLTSEPHITYMRRFFLDMCDVAQFAFENLAPAQLLWARGMAPNLSHMRRFRMKDGTCKTNPGVKNLADQILRPEGTPDDELQLIRIRREGAKEILLVNFGLHPDGIGGTKFCADWPGYVCEILKGAFDGDVEVMMLNAAQGDAIRQNQMYTHFPKGPADARRVARGISGHVLRIYDSAVEVPCDRVVGFSHIARVGKNPFDPARIPTAIAVQKIYAEKGSKAEELKEFDMGVVEACRIVRSLNQPDVFELPVSGLQLGKIAFIGLPGEPFVDIGRQIKAGSPMDVTFVTCLTNGGEGYFPTADAFREDGYERTSSPFAHDVADILVETGRNVLAEMAK